MNPAKSGGSIVRKPLLSAFLDPAKTTQRVEIKRVNHDATIASGTAYKIFAEAFTLTWRQPSRGRAAEVAALS